MKWTYLLQNIVRPVNEWKILNFQGRFYDIFCESSKPAHKSGQFYALLIVPPIFYLKNLSFSVISQLSSFLKKISLKKTRKVLNITLR